MSNPMLNPALVVLSVLSFLGGCAEPAPTVEPIAESTEPKAESATPAPTPPARAAEGAGPELDAENPELLRRPFTAEQIASAMRPGLQITVRMSGPEGDLTQLWTVLSADADGCEMEYTNLDAEGNAAGEKVVQATAWTELHEHASFPAADATSEIARRETALGALDGRLYTVDSPESGRDHGVFLRRQIRRRPGFG